VVGRSQSIEILKGRRAFVVLADCFLWTGESGGFRNTYSIMEEAFSGATRSGAQRV